MGKKRQNKLRIMFYKIIWPCVLLWIVIDTERRRFTSTAARPPFHSVLDPQCSIDVIFVLRVCVFCVFCAFWMNMLYARITWINVLSIDVRLFFAEFSLAFCWKFIQNWIYAELKAFNQNDALRIEKQQQQIKWNQMKYMCLSVVKWLAKRADRKRITRNKFKAELQNSSRIAKWNEKKNQ